MRCASRRFFVAIYYMRTDLQRYDTAAGRLDFASSHAGLMC